MKRFIFMFLILFSSVLCYSSEITVDVSAWTDEQKSQILNATASLIGNAGYTIGTNCIQRSGNRILVDETKLSPAGFNITQILSTQRIFDEANLIITNNILTNQQRETQYQSIKSAVKIKLDMTDNQFDNLIKVLKRELRE